MIKLPLGVTDTSFDWHGIVESQPLPGWVSENLPPAAVGHLGEFTSDAGDVIKAIEKYARWF